MSCLGSTTLVEMIARGQYPFAHATLMLMEIKALPRLESKSVLFKIYLGKNNVCKITLFIC